MSRVPILFAPLMLISIFGCVQSERGENVSTKLASLEARVKELEGQTQSLQSDAFNARTAQYMEGSAFLKPGDAGYSVFQTSLGSMLVSFEDIQPYASGSRVRLSIGNLTAARVQGLRAKLDWRSTADAANPTKAPRRTKEIALTESLRPGAWTEVTTALDGVPPHEFAQLQFHYVGHDSVFLVPR